MSVSAAGSGQLRAIQELHEAFAERGVDYWLFGGWAVDFHAGRVTREHDDIDLAVWRADLEVVAAALEQLGWAHLPAAGEDGYTTYARQGVPLELALLARDEDGVIYTPLTDGRGEWPAGSFGETTSEVAGVRARVVGLASLVEDKSAARVDALTTAKDRHDVDVLTQPRT